MKIDNDFGFTIEDVTPVDDTRAQQMYEAIVPLLNNLMKNPEIETIKWPNRVEKLEEFKDKLRDILEGN